MKRVVALLLLLCMLLPVTVFAAEEKLPRLAFPAANHIAYMNYEFYLQMEFRTPAVLTSGKIFELRDQNGRVWASKELKPHQEQLNFKIMPDETFLGGYDLSVWHEDTLVSINSVYVAVTDRHQKAVQTVPTTQPYMSLSFDCAYADKNTDRLLSILEELNVRATFFMTGEFLMNFPEAAKKIRDAGHEIGCHSLSHPHLLEYPLDMRVKQVRRNVELVLDTLDVVPRLFRPPFGEFDETVSAPARAEGMEVCMWTIDSHDWDWAYTPEMVLHRVTKDASPGTIILFHLDGFHTCDILPDAVRHYREELELDFVPITELMSMGGMELPDSPYLDN